MIRSMSHETTASAAGPPSAATAASASAMTDEAPAATRPTASDVARPASVRANMSRPIQSVPKRCAVEGAWFACAKSDALATGASRAPARPHDDERRGGDRDPHEEPPPAAARPSGAGRWRTVRSSPAPAVRAAAPLCTDMGRPLAHSGIDDPVEHVRHQIAGKHDGSRRKRDAHQKGRVAAEARRDGSLPEPGYENTCSTRTEPPMISLTWAHSRVSAGRARLRSPWRTTMDQGRSPRDRAKRT